MVDYQSKFRGRWQFGRVGSTTGVCDGGEDQEVV